MLQLRTAEGQSVEVRPEELVVAGFAGRDRDQVEHHIVELEALGVARPSSVPLFYRVSASLLTTASHIQVVGTQSSGEVEAVLVAAGGEIFVGVASDHTDREAEAHSVALSKQLCAKPMGATVWRFADVADHWDRLVLRAHAVIDGERVLYQEGAVAGLLPVTSLMESYAGRPGARLEAGQAMLCGTLPAIGGIRPAARFEVELVDPVRGRSLTHAYDIETLPIVS
ncbi:DUF2848 domain-containing protein [Marinimicrococcus flavescens]|uniref:DUF2848 domain-containing protein n=1 Tax=Marinimicrococcus flavescens TaxID=3031815 RepID=A0AAP3UXG0_9PROT|nr:DUF2848 domain-containing protein [Marinimicrococcus flavescens]